MAERTKSRTRELRQPAFIPKYWVGDHITVGDLQSQDDPAASSKMIDERITYTTGQAFNRCSHRALVSAFDHGGHRQSGDMVNDTWEILGHLAKDAKIPKVSILRRGGRTRCENLAQTVEVSVDPGVIAKARMDAWNRLVQLRPSRSMNVARSVLELKDSKQTMGQPLSFLNWARSNFGRKLHTGRKSYIVLGLGSKLSSVATAYLWYKFGVEPTVSDVRQFLTELGQGKLRAFGELGKTHCLAKKGEVLVARYSATLGKPRILEIMFGSNPTERFLGHLNLFPGRMLTSVTWPAKGLWDHPGDIPRGRTVRVHGEIRGCYFARAKEDVTVSGLDNLRRHWRWNFPGLKTMWDLVPFSFLVDWIVGVGDTIEALEKRYLVENYSGSLGPIWRAECERVTEYHPIVSGSLLVEGNRASGTLDPYDYGGVLISGTARYSYYQGAVQKAFQRAPVGDPMVVWPTLTRQVHAYQITSGMALLAQAARAWR